MRARAIAMAVLALLFGACDSPEAERVRGGGPGADPHNRDPIVEIHAGSRMYYETPCLMPDDSCTGPLPASGLPGKFPEPRRERPSGT